MADPEGIHQDIWHAFLSRHTVRMAEQDAFLDYLTRPSSPRVTTLRELEEAYLTFLATGDVP